MNQETVLVTGGAGYIGSHVVLQLRQAGERVVVLDNLSRGFRQAVLGAPLVIGEVGDREQLLNTLREHRVSTVMHFAAWSNVAESVSNPLKYYRNNADATRVLIECCLESGVNRFVFSSSASVYGIPESGFASEETTTRPINPYGTSKLISEWMLRDVAASSALRFVALRYFNVAGSDTECRIGESTLGSHHLVKLACETAVGKRSYIALHGTDYPTPDGTCVRDYIHVEDLATAHHAALEYLKQDGPSTILNVGYGHGYSVRDVLASVSRVAGAPFSIREEARRPGDPPTLVAQSEQIRDRLGWRPRLDDLDTIVRTQLQWEKHLLRAPW